MDTALPKTSNPAAAAFEQAGIHTLEQAGQAGAMQLSSLHGVGPKAIRILREELAKIGLEMNP
ncbi:DNA-binding protein [Glutamicibacter sp. NPDC087344]|uniref:DNA-binding protein n=1 Tax=Glutamicibacter sp. NPDC087344 TaxID=3363994 RepID=UPI0037F2351B